MKVICKACNVDTAAEGFVCCRKICPYDQFEIIGTIEIQVPVFTKKDSKPAQISDDQPLPAATHEQ